MVKKEEDRNQHYLTQERWIRAHVGAKWYLSNKVTNVSLNCVWKRHSGVFIVGPPVVWKEGYYHPRYGKSTPRARYENFWHLPFHIKKTPIIEVISKECELLSLN